MYSSFQLARKYLHYYLTAANSKGHGVHSPFVFDFIGNVLNNGRHYEPPKAIEACRQRMLSDQRVIEVEDMGAGSRAGAQHQRSIARIARSALKPLKYGRLLYRLARHYQPASIIELGTSLGITTAYLSSAVPGGTVTSIEGSAGILKVARKNLDDLQCHQVKLVKGNFDQALPELLSTLDAVDLAYIDGNHRYEPTMRYFHQFLEKAKENTILVFDDIHWSEEMEQAWEEIKKHPEVKYTIDIFFLGFVFFRKDFKVRQDFVVRF